MWGVARCCLPRSPGQPQHLKYQNRIWWWWWWMMYTSCSSHLDYGTILWILLPHIRWDKIRRLISQQFHDVNSILRLHRSIRKVEFAYHFWMCDNAVYQKLSKSGHAYRNCSLPKLAPFWDMVYIVHYPVLTHLSQPACARSLFVCGPSSCCMTD